MEYVEQSAGSKNGQNARPIIDRSHLHLQTFSHTIVKLPAFTFCLLSSVSSAVDTQDLKEKPHRCIHLLIFPFSALTCTSLHLICTSSLKHSTHPQFSSLFPPPLRLGLRWSVGCARYSRVRNDLELFLFFLLFKFPRVCV